MTYAWFIFSYLKTLVENVHRGLVFTTDKQLFVSTNNRLLWRRLNRKLMV